MNEKSNKNIQAPLKSHNLIDKKFNGYQETIINGTKLMVDPQKNTPQELLSDYELKIKYRNLESKNAPEPMVEALFEDIKITHQALLNFGTEKTFVFCHKGDEDKIIQALNNRINSLKSQQKEANLKRNRAEILDIIGASDGHMRNNTLTELNQNDAMFKKNHIPGLPMRNNTLLTREEYLAIHKNQYQHDTNHPLYKPPFPMGKGHEYNAVLTIAHDNGKKNNDIAPIEIMNNKPNFEDNENGKFPNKLTVTNNTSDQYKKESAIICVKRECLNAELRLYKIRVAAIIPQGINRYETMSRASGYSTIAEAMYISNPAGKGEITISESPEYARQGIGVALLGVLHAIPAGPNKIDPLTPIVSAPPETIHDYYNTIVYQYDRAKHLANNTSKSRDKIRDRQNIKDTHTKGGKLMESIKTGYMITGFEGVVLSVADENVRHRLPTNFVFERDTRGTCPRVINQLINQKKDIEKIIGSNPSITIVSHGDASVKDILTERIKRIEQSLREKSKDMMYGFTDHDISNALNNYIMEVLPTPHHVDQITLPPHTDIKIADSPLPSLDVNTALAVIKKTLGDKAAECGINAGVHISPSGKKYDVFINETENVVQLIDPAKKKIAAMIFAHEELKKENSSCFRIVVPQEYRGELMSIKCIDEYLKHNPIIPERFVAANENDLPSLQQYAREVKEYSGKWEMTHDAIEIFCDNNNPHFFAGIDEQHEKKVFNALREGIVPEIYHQNDKDNRSDRDDRD